MPLEKIPSDEVRHDLRSVKVFGHNDRFSGLVRYQILRCDYCSVQFGIDAFAYAYNYMHGIVKCRNCAGLSEHEYAPFMRLDVHTGKYDWLLFDKPLWRRLVGRVTRILRC